MLKKIISLFIVLGSSSAFGWGAIGHQIVAYVGANSATQGQAFWQSNLDPIRKLTTVPDRVWKTSSTYSGEAPTHWFQADSYYAPADYDQIIQFPSTYAAAVNKYSEALVLENGTAPWRIRQFYQMAVQYFKNGDMKSALAFVGVMSHYIGDLSQPLHTSENYDGQLSHNNGIHTYFETTILNNEINIRRDVQNRVNKLLNDTKFLAQFRGRLMDTILLEVERSIADKHLVLKNDTQYGRTKNGAAIQLELAKNRLADGAATLALILNQLWKDAGLTIQASPMTLQDPKWIAPNFTQLGTYSHDLISRQKRFLAEDDCLQ